MNSTPNDVLVILSEQCRHQVHLARKRMTWWIPWIFVIGLCVSIFGLIPSIAVFLEVGSATPVFVFAFFAVFFGWAVVLWLIGPFLIRPRIVPYFARGLGEYRGKTMTAFARGRGLYREIVALEQLAGTLEVKPLSAFGFAYDYYEQDVHWHAASEGLRTVEALRQGLGAHLVTAPGIRDHRMVHLSRFPWRPQMTDQGSVLRRKSRNAPFLGLKGRIPLDSLRRAGRCGGRGHLVNRLPAASIGPATRRHGARCQKEQSPRDRSFWRLRGRRKTGV